MEEKHSLNFDHETGLFFFSFQISTSYSRFPRLGVFLCPRRYLVQLGVEVQHWLLYLAWIILALFPQIPNRTMSQSNIRMFFNEFQTTFETGEKWHDHSSVENFQFSSLITAGVFPVLLPDDGGKGYFYLGSRQGNSLLYG